MKGNRYCDQNFINFLRICHETAICLDHCLYLTTPFGETSANSKRSNAINHALYQTFDKCLSVLTDNYNYFDSSNFPPDICHRPAYDIPPDNQKETDRGMAQSVSDSFWHSIRSQCIMAAYDTLVQLLADQYVSPGKLRTMPLYKTPPSAGVHEIFQKTGNFSFPQEVDNNKNQNNDNSTLTVSKENAFNGRIQDRIFCLYNGLFLNPSSQGLDLIYQTSIPYDQNYHRIAFPNTIFMSFFSHTPTPHGPIKFDFCLIGPDCHFKQDNTISYESHPTEDTNTFRYEWHCEKWLPECFPYAKKRGSYHFTLTVTLYKRNEGKDPKITQHFTADVKIENPVITSKNKIDVAESVESGEYIELKSTDDTFIFTPKNYFPLNLFHQNKEKIFSLYNIDFYAIFASIPPAKTRKMIALLYDPKHKKSSNFQELKDLCSSSSNKTSYDLYISKDPVDQLYLRYRYEKMFGFTLAQHFFTTLQRLSKKGIILNDQEIDTLCLLGSSRNIFSRPFFLSFALYPLHSNKGITSSSLDFERIDYKPYTFLRPDFYVFHREIWHNYLKKFLALWNDLVTPACEWFFILSLFHNYGINIHSPEMYSEKNLRDTLKTIYTDLSEYIKKHHVSLMQPAPYDELIPDNDEKPRKISFAVEDIVCKISEHNRMNVLNLSNENDEPVFLDSLITFNKDTLLHKENQQQVITNDQIIRQAYMSLLYGTDLR